MQIRKLLNTARIQRLFRVATRFAEQANPNICGSASISLVSAECFYTFKPRTGGCSRCKLVVVGIAVGRRFGAEAAAFLCRLAVARAREVPARLRTATRQAFLHLWMGMLAIAAQQALAHSLLEPPLSGVDACSGANRFWESRWRTRAAPTTCPAAACLPPCAPVSAARRPAKPSHQRSHRLKHVEQTESPKEKTKTRSNLARYRA